MRRARRDGEPEHDVRPTAPSVAAVAANHSGGRCHCQLPVHRFRCRNTDHHCGRQRRRVGDAKGDRQPGRRKSARRLLPCRRHSPLASPRARSRSHWRTPSATRSPSTSALTVNLSTSSGKGTFSPASPLTIPPGASTVSFQYKDTSSGSPTLTAAAIGLGVRHAARNRRIRPRPANWRLSPRPQTLTAGIAGGTIVVALEDAFGNPVGASGPLTVTLSTTSGERHVHSVFSLTIPGRGGHGQLPIRR